MAITVELTSPKAVEYFIQNVCMGDMQKFEEELNSTNTPKLQKIKKALNIKASDKEEAIKAILIAVKPEEEEKMTEENVTENVEPMPEETQSESLPPETEYPVMQIKFDHDILALVPRPAEDQFHTLKASIKERGVQEPLEVLPDGRLLDGYSRFKAMEELGMLPVPPDKIKVIDLKDEEIIPYVFDKNIARRHLSDIHKIKWAAKYVAKEELKKEAKKVKEEKKKATKEGKKPKEKKAERVRDKIAKAAGVKPGQVARHDFIEKWAPDQLADAMKTDEALGAVYLKAKEMKKVLEKEKPDYLSQIKDALKDGLTPEERIERGFTLAQMYQLLVDEKPEVLTQEKPIGKIAKTVMDIQAMIRRIWAKKYGEESNPEMWDEFDKEIDERLQTNVDSLIESGK